MQSHNNLSLTISLSVYKWNHDPMYNDSGSISDDNIEHVYIEKFEDFEENMEDYLSKHGRKFLML